MVIPRFDLALRLGEILPALLQVAAGRGDASPDAVPAFEQAFADWLGTRHAIFVPSARTGLYLILEAAQRLGRLPRDLSPGGPRPGVLVPSWTHASVPTVVRSAGWEPRFLDCDPSAQNSTPAHADAANAWDGAVAAIVTHLYGCPTDSQEWVDRARARGMLVVEDCAQALGARLRGRKVGTFGDAAYFSFALTKNFTTLGGGMVATSDDALAAAMRERMQTVPAGGAAARKALLKPLVMGLGFRVATWPSIFAATLYPALRVGWKLTGRDRLHDLFDEPVRFSPPQGAIGSPFGVQATVGLHQLPRLDAENARRTAIGRRLRAALENTPLGLPTWLDDSDPIFMSFVVRAPERFRFMRTLLGHGVDSSPGYLRACHRLDAASGDSTPTLPGAEELESQQVHLPVYPRLTDREVDCIAQAVHRTCREIYPSRTRRRVQGATS